MKIKRLTASFIISAMVIGTVGCSDKIELSNDSYENDSTDQVTEDLSATEEAEGDFKVMAISFHTSSMNLPLEK